MNNLICYMIAAAAVGGTSAAPTTADWEIGQSVKTSSGKIAGHKSDWIPEVSEYLGIPFAKPPVGKLRWAPPQAYESDEEFVASNFSDSCPTLVLKPSEDAKVPYEGNSTETIAGVIGQWEEKVSEDCLGLNVWTAPQKGDKKKAVLLWAYGGGMQYGSSTADMYNGARLAEEQDVVVVSFNYRVNIFGFPMAEFLDDYNLGILDHRLAVEWVRDNIEEFGGDPEKITLFGESAGAVLVDNWAYAWQDDPIVKGLIIQSGNVYDVNEEAREQQTKVWYNATAKLECGDEDDGEKTIDCMREKKWEDVIDAIFEVDENGMLTSGVGGQFSTMSDNKTVFPDYTKRLAEGNFSKIPILMGHNSDEGPLAWQQLLSCFPRWVTLARIKRFIPAWRYVYAGAFPNMRREGSPGAWHGAEIPMVFGTAEYATQIDSTEEQEKLSLEMRTAWARFAKAPWFGLLLHGWPLYLDFDNVIRLGGENSSEIAFEPDENFTEHCPALGDIEL